MNGLLLTSLALPLLGFLLVFLSDKNEKKIANISFWCSHAIGLSIIALLILWAMAGFPNHEYQWFTLYESGEYRFPILFYLDRVGAVYLFCVWAIFSIIVKYCRVYLHREEGYKRFFMTIFGFVFGLNGHFPALLICFLLAGKLSA
jgi:NADH:ubiquinone oxidoreductase subunit 5 (subunit L)/multisubunit Na+/H+ antiporter MnhA subunit